MTDFQDYSEGFIPILSPQRFSRDALAGIWAAAAHDHVRPDKLRATTAGKWVGNGVVPDCFRQVWGTSWSGDVRRTSRATNICEAEVATFFSCSPENPGHGVILAIACELYNPDLECFTIRRCRVPNGTLVSLADSKGDQAGRSGRCFSIPEESELFQLQDEDEALKVANGGITRKSPAAEK